jgi:hypothetical protein
MDLEKEVKVEKVEINKEVEERLKKMEIEETKEYTEYYIRLRRYAKIKSREEFCGKY